MRNVSGTPCRCQWWCCCALACYTPETSLWEFLCHCLFQWTPMVRQWYIRLRAVLPPPNSISENCWNLVPQCRIKGDKFHAAVAVVAACPLCLQCWYDCCRHPLQHACQPRWGDGPCVADDVQVRLCGRALWWCQGWHHDWPEEVLRQWAGEDHQEIHHRTSQKRISGWVTLTPACWPWPWNSFAKSRQC